MQASHTATILGWDRQWQVAVATKDLLDRKHEAERAGDRTVVLLQGAESNMAYPPRSLPSSTPPLKDWIPARSMQDWLGPGQGWRGTWFEA